MAKLDKKIVITGGGSGGHANAGISFAKFLEKKYSHALEKILYIGGNLAMEGEKNTKSIEERLLEKTKFKYKIIRAGKFQRYFNLRTIVLLFKVLGGVIDSFKILKKEKPDLIFSTGGYVTVPVCFAGWILKIPVYIHEQTITVGLANKLSAKFAEKVFITFVESKKFFPKEKTIHTGNIVNDDLFEKESNGEIVDVMKRMHKERNEYPILYISGGSQGSHLLNTTVREMIPYLIQYYQVILQTGENKIHNDFEILSKDKKKLSEKVRDRFYPVKYFDSSEMGFIYKNVDLFVGRSGANTVYELGLMKTPSILIPIPWSRNNEQHKNAEILQKHGLAKIIPEGELTPDKLLIDINKMMKEEREIDKKSLEQIFTKDAKKKILELIL
jgi:UDP-N-acetylglucosamine--N-acetylmuramyl-(pentapeptide) pyrophosphoryl-undecaprenol N-acetylglucosamine transferase